MALPSDALEEVVNGAVRKMPPPDKAHTRLLTVLARKLPKQLEELRYEVVTTASGLGIRRSPSIAIRNPDLAVFETDDLTARVRCISCSQTMEALEPPKSG